MALAIQADTAATSHPGRDITGHRHDDSEDAVRNGKKHKQEN
jgi:hypothetical protein